MEKQELDNLVSDYVAIEQDIKQRELVAENVRNQIKKEMEDRHLDTYKSGEYLVRYKDVLKSVFNASLFKKKYSELYTLYLSQVLTKKFSIS